MSEMISEKQYNDKSKYAKLLKNNAFLKAIGEVYSKDIVKAFNLKGGGGSTNPSKTAKKPSKTQKSTYTGNSIVEYLQSIGQPSSFNHRKKLASKHGIKNYTGTASQNLQLLRILRDGAKVSASKPKKTISQMANEVIAGKHGNGHAQRQKSLGVDNATYQKVRREVNRRLK